MGSPFFFYGAVNIFHSLLYRKSLLKGTWFHSFHYPLWHGTLASGNLSSATGEAIENGHLYFNPDRIHSHFNPLENVMATIRKRRIW